MADLPNRQEEIFLEALDISPAERGCFLAQACGADEAMRRRVDAMLQAHATDDSFLEKPAAAMGPTIDDISRPLEEEATTQVGPYKLLQKLGEGAWVRSGSPSRPSR